MKLSTLLILNLFLFTISRGQVVSKNILVEHFTNTKCSVCAVHNPGFYQAMAAQGGVIHVAYHPSAPYSTCLFSTQNKIENDARTNYYEQYGGTPIFIINGVQKFGSQVQTTAVYNEFENQTSPLSIALQFLPTPTTQPNTIKVEVRIKAEAVHGFDSLSLYVPLVEDTIFYNAPNGENLHFDVFRKSFTDSTSKRFKVPSAIGEEYIFSDTVLIKGTWNIDRLYAIAIVQADNSSIVQANKSAFYNAPALPVEFISFEATTIDQQILLTWAIGNKVNASHFEILRSHDGSEFSTIGNIRITDEAIYSFIDEKPNLGINYYQLKEVDLDGLHQYSWIVSQSVRPANMIKIYPTIVQDGVLYIQQIDEPNAKVKLISSEGKLVYDTIINNGQIALDHLSNGVYILSIMSANDMMLEHRKIVVMK